jgi:hypothetical protein
MVLRVFVILSGLLEAGAGIWSIFNGDRILKQLAGVAPAAPAVTASGVFIGLVCLLIASLHYLIWRWLREERDEAYALINLYGVFGFAAGVVLFAAFRPTGSAALAAWVPLVYDSVRGAALVVLGSLARHMPNTVRELRLPAVTARSSRAPEPRGEARARGREDERRRGGARRREGVGRGVPEAPPVAARARAAAVSAPPPRPPIEMPMPASSAAGADLEAGRRRARGRRGGRRGRSGRETEFTARPLPASEIASAPRTVPEPIQVRPLPPVAEP